MIASAGRQASAGAQESCSGPLTPAHTCGHTSSHSPTHLLEVQVQHIGCGCLRRVVALLLRMLLERLSCSRAATTCATQCTRGECFVLSIREQQRTVIKTLQAVGAALTAMVLLSCFLRAFAVLINPCLTVGPPHALGCFPDPRPTKNASAFFLLHGASIPCSAVCATGTRCCSTAQVPWQSMQWHRSIASPNDYLHAALVFKPTGCMLLWGHGPQTNRSHLCIDRPAGLPQLVEPCLRAAHSTAAVVCMRSPMARVAVVTSVELVEFEYLSLHMI